MIPVVRFLVVELRSHHGHMDLAAKRTKTKKQKQYCINSKFPPGPLAAKTLNLYIICIFLLFYVFGASDVKKVRDDITNNIFSLVCFIFFSIYFY